MSTAIEWTHRPGTTGETWNPVTGCAKVSPGCDHCYAERVTERWQGKGAFDKVVLHEDRLSKPLSWRKPRTVFVNSMSDLFHEDVPDEYIAEVFSTMYQAPRHVFQVLTKRHARMRAWVNRCSEWSGYITHNGQPPRCDGGNGIIVGTTDKWPLPNVWLGVSVEDQKWADIRIPALLDTPAAVRFLSCEPLLGPIDLDRWLWAECEACGGVGTQWVSGSVAVDCHCAGGCESAGDLHWVIVGGESGLAARPMQVDWARLLRNRCAAARVPFFFKQWGGRTPKANGRELDGREWNEYPGGER